MQRYLKVNNTWLDTLTELRDNHLVYMVIDNKVIVIHQDNTEETIGDLEDERDSEENR